MESEMKIMRMKVVFSPASLSVKLIRRQKELERIAIDRTEYICSCLLLVLQVSGNDLLVQLAAQPWFCKELYRIYNCNIYLVIVHFMGIILLAMHGEKDK